MRKSTSLFFIIMLFASMSLFAQRYTISGTVKDATTGEALIGASISLSALNTGAMADANGSYKIENIPAGTYELAVSYIGYTKTSKNVSVHGNVTLNFTLESTGISLQETVVKGTRATLRETPVAFSSVSGKDLEARLASRDVPMELAMTPSVYASQSGGGAGDATMFIRGFSQRNIAIMINGVPVNDMENKWVYWSNWAGIGDVTDDIQVQRGLGASPYSVNAIGGVLNVMTAGAGSDEHFIKFKQEFGANALTKTSLAISNQKITKNLSFSALISRKTQDGYADNTWGQEWTYYVAIGGVFGNHTLEIQAIGSPQSHGQRSSSYARLPINTIYNTNGTVKTYGWDIMGHEFNYSAGRLNGGWFTEVENSFHKPAFNLNWNWQMSKNSSLSTVAYYSLGRGWGSGTLGAYAPSITSGEYLNYRDYDSVYKTNAALAAAGTALTSSQTVIRKNINNHDWFGLLSTFKTVLSKQLTLSAGIDGRYYIGKHWQELKDLIGGTTYKDSYDLNSGTRILHVGDNSTYHYEGHVRQIGGFGQLEFKTGAISTFLNTSVSTTGYQREDFFNYAAGLQKSDWQNFTGYTVKTGLNYNLDENNSVFVNVGHFSTPPIFTNVFVGGNSTAANKTYADAKNEKIYAAEIGYNLATQDFTVSANGFYTQWLDRSFTQSTTVSTTKEVLYYNIQGSKQLHMGAEVEATYKVLRNLNFRGTFSLIRAKYQNDVSANVYSDQTGGFVKTVNVYSDGLFVSEFPQLMATLEGYYRLNIVSGFDVYFNPVYKFNGNQHAYFNPDYRTTATDRNQSWTMPDYSIVDMHIGCNWYLTDFMIKKVNLAFHMFNVLDNKDYIVEAQDAYYKSSITGTYDHTSECAAVFYGRPLWWNISLAVGF
jgi:iron complex outermembrane recepter protein